MTQTPVAAGKNLRRIGEDAPRGGTLFAAGRRLSPLGAALAVLAGIASVAVRVPRVHVLHAGSAEAAAAARLVAMAAHRIGAACRISAIGSPAEPSDDSSCQLTIAVGGAAIGPGDAALAWVVARDGWREIGCPAMRPGDTVVCGTAVTGPVIVVPSRLDAVLSAVLLIVRPAIGALAAAGDLPLRATRPLTRKIASAVGMSELVLLADAESGRAWAPIGVGDFGWIDSTSALAYAEIPAESEGVGEGDAFEGTMLVGPGSPGLWSEA
jgi:molybdopterin biosynthesis enzyme